MDLLNLIVPGTGFLRKVAQLVAMEEDRHMN
jgi:hypothetical protein